MTEPPLYFELPGSLKGKKFFSKIEKKLLLQITGQHYAIKTFYDTFDWRLYRAGVVAEHIHSKDVSQFNLINRKTGRLLASDSLETAPNFAQQFSSQALKSILLPIMEMRALLQVSHLPLEIYRANILNKDEKTVLRLQLDDYESLSGRIHLLPLRGYGKSLNKVAAVLQSDLSVKPASCSVLPEALQLQGREVKDYSSKFSLKLKPDMRADQAAKLIFKTLLADIKLNEANTITDVDTEFLHDFRVAVRRTRSGLNQIRGALPETAVKKYSEFFAWLGQITSLTRDLDVYLLSYQDYRGVLPIAMQDDLEPLYAFLKEKQIKAQKNLAERLVSAKYQKGLIEWEEFLNKQVSKKAKANQGNLSIKALADQRIWKVYCKLMSEGGVIDDQSPPESLHDLRKTCKKLRYLLEFFQSLYDETEMKTLIKALKGLQTVLGDFQDYEVQENNIKTFSQEMMENHVGGNAILAMGVLIQHLDAKKRDAREHFSDQFAGFANQDIKRIFEKLFFRKKV